MPELKPLTAGHAPAVLAFELANRAYFAASISDRGDGYFDQFTDRYNALLAEQEAGICAFHVLVDDDGSVLGRFNLVDIDDHVAEQLAGKHALDRVLLRRQRMVVPVLQDESLAVLRGIGAQFGQPFHTVYRERGLVRPDDRTIGIDQQNALGKPGDDLLQLPPIDLGFDSRCVHRPLRRRIVPSGTLLQGWRKPAPLARPEIPGRLVQPALAGVLRSS